MSMVQQLLRTMPLNRRLIQRCVLAILAGLAVALLIGPTVSAAVRPLNTDFYVFYESARNWRAGSDLYSTALKSPNLNPPHFVVAFGPFTLMQPRVAVLVWLTLNVVAAIHAVILIWRELALPRSFNAIMMAIVAAGITTGMQFGFEEGQPTGIFAWLSTSAWLAVRRKDQGRAGLLLGLLISVKPFFAILLLAPLVKRQWRVVIWSAFAGAGMLLFGVALAGVASYARWIEVGTHVSWFVHPLNGSIMGPIARLGLSWPVWVALSVPIVVATVVAIHKSEGPDAGWLVAGLASLLLGPLGWLYYLPLLAGPLTAAARRRPAMLSWGVGFLWPMPLLIAAAPITRLNALLIFSIPAWSMLALWGAVIWENVRSQDAMKIAA